MLINDRPQHHVGADLGAHDSLLITGEVRPGIPLSGCFSLLLWQIFCPLCHWHDLKSLQAAWTAKPGQG
jgi:hypothetical protein